MKSEPVQRINTFAKGLLYFTFPLSIDQGTRNSPLSYKVSGKNMKSAKQGRLNLSATLTYMNVFHRLMSMRKDLAKKKILENFLKGGRK